MTRALLFSTLLAGTLIVAADHGAEAQTTQDELRNVTAYRFQVVSLNEASKRCGLDQVAMREAFTQSMIDAGLKGKIDFKGAGVEKNLVVLEGYGTARDRTRVESKLPEALLGSIKRLDRPQDEVFRVMIANRISEELSRRRRGPRRTKKESVP